jgi:hypothetical protein
MDLKSVLRLIANLNKEAAEYILVGAGALNILGVVRATEDVDFFIRPDLPNIELVKGALRATWDDPSIEEIQADELLSDYPVIRYGPPGEAYTVDLMTRLGEAVQYQDLDWEWRELDGIPIRVATPATLYRMKAGTLRAQDHLDAALLKELYDLKGEDGAG